MSELEEKLIGIVSEYKELYDVDQAAYSNIKLKKQIWQNIAVKLNVSAELCKKKWRNIRDSYRKYMREIKSKTEQEIRVTKRYKYAYLLEFLNPYMQERIVVSSFFNDDENQDEHTEGSGNENQNESDRGTEDMDEYSGDRDVDEDETRSDEIRRAKKRQAVFLNETPSNMLLPYKSGHEKIKKRRKNRDEDDALRQLFLSMYATVKTFPPTLRTETKMKLFSIISNAELEYLKCKEGTSNAVPSSSPYSAPMSSPPMPYFTQCKTENLL